MLLGLLAVRNQPPGLRSWFTPFTSLGLAMPSFYIGSLCILAIVFLSMAKGSTDEMLAPIRGFGWDAHLILPVIALMLFPTVQIAQVTANLMVDELGKQYIIAARSFGYTWHDIHWRQVMRNIIATVILTIAKTFRILDGELVVVEWLFNWPGLGKLLASTLVPGKLSTNMGESRLFLDPSIIAFDIVIIADLFLLVEIFCIRYCAYSRPAAEELG
jgi:peptide/nickel transport system permease protein